MIRELDSFSVINYLCNLCNLRMKFFSGLFLT